MKSSKQAKMSAYVTRQGGEKVKKIIIWSTFDNDNSKNRNHFAKSLENAIAGL